MDWKAVPTITRSCGRGMFQYMGAQPMKSPPSWTMVRRSGRTASSAAASSRGSSLPSTVSAEPAEWPGPAARA
jgi:hypothetical protein